MIEEYKELLITDELNIAKKARAEGRNVVLCYPLLCDGGPAEEISMEEFPYAVARQEDGSLVLDENYLKHVISRLKGEPCHILDTRRCRIREITVEDLDALYEIYSEPGITDYMEPLYENRGDEEKYTRDYIRCHYGFYDFGMWIVEDIRTGKIIGRAGFDMRQGYENPELGFLICKEYQGKGYATEVCENLLLYGRDKLGFEEVGAFTDRENTASVSLLEKLGFSFRRENIVKTVKNDVENLDYYVKRL